jgi:polyisoprenoid-binding protein YceI
LGGPAYAGQRVLDLMSKHRGKAGDRARSPAMRHLAVDLVGEKPESSSVNVDIETASIYANVDQLTQHLKTPDFFDVEKYPQITFTARHCDVQMEPDGAFHARLQGVMTVHGADHEMILDAEGHLSGGDIVATSHLSIPYVEWGMKDPSLLLLTVEKNVDIDVATTGRILWTEEASRDRSVNR